MKKNKCLKLVLPRCILVATFGLAAMLETSVSMASSSVTVYGIIDTGLYYNHVSRDAGSLGSAISESQAGMTSGAINSSRWGIKGSEALSDQWSVQFVLEAGVNSNDGTLGQGGLGFGRQSTLTIANNRWGSLQFGRAPNLAYHYMATIDPFSIPNTQASLGASFGSANSVRPNNLLLYESGNIHGWQASVGYSFNTGFSAIYANGPSNAVQPGTQFFGTTANMRMLTAALAYNRGGLSLFATFDAVFGANQVATSSGQTVSNPNNATPKAWILAASYDFKVIKASAVIGQTYDGAFFGQGAGANGYSTPLANVSDGANVLFAQGAKSSQYALAATIPVGPQGSVWLSWQMLQPTGALSANTELATQSIVSGAYVYNLSKRTALYVWGSYGNNYQTFSTAKSTVVGTGVRHFF